MKINCPKWKDKKNDFCGFEPAKMHCDFTYFPNAFQTRFDRISNSICYKGDRIMINWSSIFNDYHLEII